MIVKMLGSTALIVALLLLALPVMVASDDEEIQGCSQEYNGTYGIFQHNIQGDSETPASDTRHIIMDVGCEITLTSHDTCESQWFSHTMNNTVCLHAPPGKVINLRVDSMDVPEANERQMYDSCTGVGQTIVECEENAIVIYNDDFEPIATWCTSKDVSETGTVLNSYNNMTLNFITKRRYLGTGFAFSIWITDRPSEMSKRPGYEDSICTKPKRHGARNDYAYQGWSCYTGDVAVTSLMWTNINEFPNPGEGCRGPLELEVDPLEHEVDPLWFGDIATPMWDGQTPYGPNKDYAWLVSTGKNSFASIRIISMDIECTIGSAESHDSLDFYNVPKDYTHESHDQHSKVQLRDYMMLSVCGNRTVPMFTNHVNKSLLITFQSRHHSPAAWSWTFRREMTSTGFFIEIEKTDQVIWPEDACMFGPLRLQAENRIGNQEHPVLIRSPAVLISSPYRDDYYTYPGDDWCTWTIEAPTCDSLIKIKFTKFQLEYWYDYLHICDSTFKKEGYVANLGHLRHIFSHPGGTCDNWAMLNGYMTGESFIFPDYYGGLGMLNESLGFEWKGRMTLSFFSDWSVEYGGFEGEVYFEDDNNNNNKHPESWGTVYPQRWYYPFHLWKSWSARGRPLVYPGGWMYTPNLEDGRARRIVRWPYTTARYD